MTVKPDTKAAPVATADVEASEVVDDLLAPSATSALALREADDEERATIRLVESEKQSLVAQLSSMDDAMRIFQKRAELLENCRLYAIRATNPVDWILSRGDSGDEIAMPSDSACTKIADVYGIDLTEVKPLDSRGVFSPEVETDDKGRTTYRGWASASSRTTGRRIVMIECARRDDEKFIGRDDNPNDIRSAVLTLMRSKATRIISGLAKVPRAVLEAAWSGTPKNTEQCTKGHGYGSGADRRAAAVAPKEVVDLGVALGNEIMARVGGDTSAAKDLLVELTKSADGKFKGFDSVKRLTKDWQVKNAWERLRAHKVFGDKAIGLPDGGSAVPADEKNGHATEGQS